MVGENVDFFCLFSVNDRLVNDGICAYNFALNALEYRNNFDTVG